MAAEAVLDLLEKAGLKPHMVSEEEAQRVLAEKNGDTAFDNSKKGISFVLTNKIPKDELAVAHQALFAKVQDQAQEGTVYGVFSAKHYHVFNGSQHQYAVPIVGNEEIIDDIQNEINNGTYGNTNSIGRWLESFQGRERYDSRHRANASRQRGGDVAVDALHGGQSTDTQRNSEESNGDSRAATPLRTASGIIYGYAKGGEIYLVEGRLNPDTPLHEYTHLWDAACRRTNPELWRRGVELMKRTPLWDEVKNDPNYANLTTDDEIAGEAHARLSGRDGAALLERMAEEAEEMDAMAMTERLGLVARLKKWMADFWKWTRDTFAPWTKAEAAEVSLDDFVRMPLADLARGVNPNEAGRNAEADGGVQFMGSRVDRRMGEIADHYDGRELTDEQQAIVDVFGGERSNASVAFTDGSGQGRTLHVRSGNENRGGVKHAIYRHYNGGQGRFEADDIAKIPTVLEQGQRTEKGDGRVEYAYTDEDGVKYTVGTTTLEKGAGEDMVTFYTNRKASQSPLSNTQLSAQQETDASNPSAKVGESSETAKSDDGTPHIVGGESAAVERVATEFGKVLEGKGKAGRLTKLVEEAQNGYILLRKTFTYLNEARVKKGLKPLSVAQDMETVAAGVRSHASGMLAVFDSYGHKKAYRGVLKKVAESFGIEKEQAKERLDDYLMARSSFTPLNYI